MQPGLDAAAQGSPLAERSPDRSLGARQWEICALRASCPAPRCHIGPPTHHGISSPPPQACSRRARRASVAASPAPSRPAGRRRTCWGARAGGHNERPAGPPAHQYAPQKPVREGSRLGGHQTRTRSTSASPSRSTDWVFNRMVVQGGCSDWRDDRQVRLSGARVAPGQGVGSCPRSTARAARAPRGRAAGPRQAGAGCKMHAGHGTQAPGGVCTGGAE
jgi:hypothetical protein